MLTPAASSTSISGTLSRLATKRAASPAPSSRPSVMITSRVTYGGRSDDRLRAHPAGPADPRAGAPDPLLSHDPRAAQGAGPGVPVEGILGAGGVPRARRGIR